MISFRVDDSHSNLIVIDRQSKKIEHYEPHGGLFSTKANTVKHRKFMEDIELLFKRLFPNYTYEPPHQVCPAFPFHDGCSVQDGVHQCPSDCPRTGLQKVQESVMGKDPIIESCNAWTLAYLRARIQAGAGANAATVRMKHMSEVMGGDPTLNIECQKQLKSNRGGESDPISLLERACAEDRKGPLFEACQEHCGVWSGIKKRLKNYLLKFTQEMLENMGAVIKKDQKVLVFHLDADFFYHSGNVADLESVLNGMGEWEREFWYIDTRSFNLVFSGNGRLILQHPRVGTV